MTVVNTQLPVMIENVLAARDTLVLHRREILIVAGQYLLYKTQLDYRTKARGGTGEDGVRWQRLQRKTIEQRVRSRGPAKAIVAQRKALAAQIAGILNQTTPIPNSYAMVATLRQRRRDLSNRLQQLIDAEFSHYEIGVDTGLQRASATPAYSATNGTAGGNLREVNSAEVEIAYTREYSPYFDLNRKLFPEEIPQLWSTELDRIVEDWAVTILTRELGNGF